MTSYVERLADPVVEEILNTVPALMLVGPRATGKTTTARRYARTVVRLDAPEGDVFRTDPDGALRGLDEPVLLDEWQAVPQILGAVKRTLDEEAFRPGRFIITGSVRSASDPVTWPGTGRFVRVTMYGLTERELQGRVRGAPVLDRIVAGGLTAAADPPDLRAYVELALRPGFPEPVLHLAPKARPMWLGSYADQLVVRDTAQVDTVRDPMKMRRYLQACAATTAGVPEHKTLYESAGIDRKTASAYDEALASLLVVDEAPAWHSNRLKRLVRSPKRYMVDAALGAAVLGLDVSAVMKDPDYLGRLIDTFVAAQLRAELALLSARKPLFHMRQQEGRREVDILLESADGRIVAIEVKAGQPRSDDARHLRWLRDELGESFAAGIVLHAGRLLTELDDRIIAAPIAVIWS